ncbi:hypothetical protein BDM02DRAFT_3155589 [Thelephora ganbajun]|uniref:Uncharacterized protein n=1 Tax=Thelephora ganbajun TaxID=370292 RepID=A0ACB6ZGN9_THEGA|nr:hypothetical protein BDM02DRAFT_3155589 [Thelephora ganbajun]
MAFPEPQLHRSSSRGFALGTEPQLRHRASRSDTGLVASTESLLATEEGLRLFQEGQLPDTDQEWYRLVPKEAQVVLDKNEVKRQSVLFEVFKSEKDYVTDLELVQEVFIDGLLNANPPVIDPEHLRPFISEVFGNIEAISSHHHRMLAALFSRQREQHPLVQSVTDVVLDTSLLFRSDYETYIKSYPLAEARHRSELKKNSKYGEWLQQCYQDPQIRKRDLVTFISRPVTRLPRLSLVLEAILKLTDSEHPDKESLPLLISILSDFVKSTQPGIAVAEAKVKFWNLCESLAYVKGEIVDMDLYNESRSLVYSGTLARRMRSDMGHTWVDLHVALLDNYLLLTKEEQRNGVTKYRIMSRPIPLEYLRLGSFDDPSDNRRERLEDAGILDRVRPTYKPLYPFKIYHASSKATRSYTLYAPSEGMRKKWNYALADAITVRKVHQESNMWLAPHDVRTGFYQYLKHGQPPDDSIHIMGRITAAAPMSSYGRSFVIIGSATGIYTAQRGKSDLTKILSITSPTSIYTLPDFNKVIIHHNHEIISYSLDMFARLSLGNSSRSSLESTYEKVSGNEGNVLFCKPGVTGKRTMLLYAAKSFLQVTIYALEVILPNEVQTRRRHEGSLSFRSFGDPFAVPRDAYDVTLLTKTIGICTEKGIVVADPTNLTSGTFSLVPDFAGAHENTVLNSLKSKCEAAKPLGMVRCDASELLVIYDDLGCYITRHGAPTRSCSYIRWEAKATSCAHVGIYLLLFSSEFVEIRHIQSGRLVQVLEGEDIRLLHSGLLPGEKVTLIALRDGTSDVPGPKDKIVELVETQELNRSPSTSSSSTFTPRSEHAASDIWDMWE